MRLKIRIQRFQPTLQIFKREIVELRFPTREQNFAISDSENQRVSHLRTHLGAVPYQDLHRPKEVLARLMLQKNLLAA